MKFGLNQKDWNLVSALVIEPLKKNGARVYIFGSRATGKNREFSDLDILYSIKDKPPLHTIGQIKDDIEDSHLPIKVDIVDLDELAPSYMEQILKERVEV